MLFNFGMDHFERESGMREDIDKVDQLQEEIPDGLVLWAHPLGQDLQGRGVMADDDFALEERFYHHHRMFCKD